MRAPRICGGRHNVLLKLFTTTVAWVLLMIAFPLQVNALARLLHQAETAQKDIGGVLGVECRDGSQLVAALADVSVRAAFVSTDVFLSESNWANHPMPIPLGRNFTVLGTYEKKEQWPLLDFGFVRGGVLLDPGVTLTFSRLVLARVRKGPYFQVPGVDLLVNVPRNDSLPMSFAVFFDGAYIQRTCLPPSFYKASSENLNRPREIPGVQAAGRLATWSDCVNSSSAQAFQRCWPAVGMYKDIATYGSDVGSAGTPLPNNYILWTVKVYYMCPVIMEEDCVKTSGGLVGCYYRMFPPGESANFLGAVTLSPPLPSSSLPLAAGDEDGDGDDASVPLGPLLGGLLGGLALLAGVTGLLAVVFYKRWGARSTRSAPYKDPPTAAGESWSGVSPSLAVQQAVTVKVKVLQQVHSGIAGFDRPSAMGSEANSLVGSGPTRPCEAIGAVAAASLILRQSGDAAATAADGGSIVRHNSKLPVNLEDLAMVPVTALTPLQNDINLQVKVEEGEVVLLSETLGKGSFGRVVVGLYGGVRVAVKLMNTGLIEAMPPAPAPDVGGSGRQAVDGTATNPTTDEDTQQKELCWSSLLQEVEVLARCEHPNIVRLLAASLHPPHVCLVMELMDTSLDRLLYGQDGGIMPLPVVLIIGIQIARALSYLHPTILHRDLKPANVLISQPDSDRPVAKLADFGLSRLRNTVLMTCNPEVGTVPYMAPETFELGNLTITDRTDIYALGVVLWEMLAGQRPWEGLPMMQVAYGVTVANQRLSFRCIPEDRCRPKLKALVLSCWDSDPARRPAAAEVAKTLTLVLESVRLAT